MSRRRCPFEGLDRPAPPIGPFGILAGALAVAAATFGLIWAGAILEAVLSVNTYY